MGSFNIVQFRKETKNARLGCVSFARNAALAKFVAAKKQTMEDFDNHLITRELEAGADAVNLSDTLGGRPNLFGFLGFMFGENPIPPLRAALDSSIEMKNVPIVQDLTTLVNFIFQVSVPSLNELYESTGVRLSWDIGNWIQAIEDGIPGLTRYIYWRLDSENSRSKIGLQAKKEIRNLEYNKTDYITGILKEFLKNFRTMNL